MPTRPMPRGRMSCSCRNCAAARPLRACIFATLHREATEILMRKLDESGLRTYVGKVNMDRNSPDNLREASAAASAGRYPSLAGRGSGACKTASPS